MAKRKKTPLKLKQVKNLANGYVVRFKDNKGRFTKPDARRKLVSAIYKKQGKKLLKTNLTFNKISKGKAKPEKFKKLFIMKTKVLNKYSTEVFQPKSDFNQETYIFNAHYPIEDNVLLKADKFIQYCRVKNRVTRLTIDYALPDRQPTKRAFIFKNYAPSLIVREISKTIIYDIYNKAYRASSLKDSGRPTNQYLRSFKIVFNWVQI